MSHEAAAREAQIGSVLREEVERLRAELAASRESLDRLQQTWAENKPAAQYKAELAESVRAIDTLHDQRRALEAERDALRALLVRCRAWIPDDKGADALLATYEAGLLADIDAAIKGQA